MKEQLEALATAVRTTDKQHLNELIHRIGDDIFDLVLAGNTGNNAKVRQILAAQQRILHRRVIDDRSDLPAKELDHVAIYDLMAMVLMAEALDWRLSTDIKSSDERHENDRLRAMLRSALSTFDKALGQHRLSPLREPDTLAKRIWSAFYEVSVAEAQRDAEAMQALFKK